MILDEISSSDTIPTNIISNNTSTIEHEATVSKISEEQLFYLMSRGLSKEDATQMIILGFIEPFTRELPMEYAVELNHIGLKPAQSRRMYVSRYTAVTDARNSIYLRIPEP